MNVIFAAGVCAAGSAAYWRIAHDAARTRRLDIGTFPWIGALAATALAAYAGKNGEALGFICAIPAVMVAAISDARTGFIFDPLSMTLLATSALVALVSAQLPAATCGACAIGGALGVLHAGTRGRGIGLGDVKLGAGIGAALGAVHGGYALAYAFILGGGYGAVLLAGRRAQRNDAIRFGPFLAAGTAAAMIVPVLP